MRLKHIPQEDEIVNFQLPDTPMFRYIGEKHPCKQPLEPSSC
jgi:hypothetical protein